MFIKCKTIVLIALGGVTQLAMTAPVLPKAESVVLSELSAHELIFRGQYQAAIDKIVASLEETRGAGVNSERAVLLSNLGMAQNKLGRFAEAENSLEKSVRMWKALGQTETDSYARTLNNLANVFLNQQRYAKAEAMFKAALLLHRAAGGDNRAEIALVLSNIGLTVALMQRYSEAEQLFQESLELQRTCKSTDLLAVTLNNLGLTYKLQGRLEDAARMYTQAVEAWMPDAAYVRPEVASGYHNLAMVETTLGQTKNAEEHFRQALETVNATLPPQHPTRIAILKGYADLLKKAGRKHEAKQFQALAQAMRAQHDHENFQDLSVSVQQIAR